MMAHMALLPIAPIILLPFIAIFFIVVFPLWIVALAVLGLFLLLARGTDYLLRLAGVQTPTAVARGVSNAFHWTLSWGGLANRRDRPEPEPRP